MQGAFYKECKMKFWKMNGAGNDFILINNMEEKLPAGCFPELAKALCTRRLSIGADGLMVVETPTQGGDLKMVFYNSDGSLGEMCGNGARCICRYAYETGLSGEEPVIETTAGIVTGRRLSTRQYRIRLNDPSVIEKSHPIELEGRVWGASYVVLGDPGIPHACVPYPGLKETEPEKLVELGRKMRFHPTFPKGANVNFYEILENGEIFERTYERGVEDFTYACGTGTGSVAASLAAAGAACGTVSKDEEGREVRSFVLHMAGGTLTVETVMEGERVAELYLTGPTNIVAIGEVKDEEVTLA